MGVLTREKHPLQQLHLKRGVGVFLRVGLFSGDYGIHNQALHSSFALSLRVFSYILLLQVMKTLTGPRKNFKVGKLNVERRS